MKEKEFDKLVDDVTARVSFRILSADWTCYKCGNSSSILGRLEKLEQEAAKRRRIVDAVEVVRCKDCKYYLRNKIHVIEGIPLMCNEVCEKWGGGCRTDENGFCYMGERSEE